MPPTKRGKFDSGLRIHILYLHVNIFYNTVLTVLGTSYLLKYYEMSKIVYFCYFVNKMTINKTSYLNIF